MKEYQAIKYNRFIYYIYNQAYIINDCNLIVFLFGLSRDFYIHRVKPKSIIFIIKNKRFKCYISHPVKDYTIIL